MWGGEVQDRCKCLGEEFLPTTRNKIRNLVYCLQLKEISNSTLHMRSGVSTQKGQQR